MRSMSPKPTMVVALSLLGLGVGAARADLTGYTKFSEFEAALAASGINAVTEGFDSTSAGTVIYDDDTVAGFEFSSIVLRNTSNLMITDNDPDLTRSRPNSIGTVDGTDEQLWNGEGFTLTFPETNAFGAWFQITTDASAAVDGDFTVTVEGTPQDSSAADYVTIYDPGTGTPTLGWFIGFIDETSPFRSAQLSSYDDGLGGDYFTFRIDDIITGSAPTPPSLALLGLGTAILALGNRRRRPGRR
jgi:hypothetical protein